MQVAGLALGAGTSTTSQLTEEEEEERGFITVRTATPFSIHVVYLMKDVALHHLKLARTVLHRRYIKLLCVWMGHEGP